MAGAQVVAIECEGYKILNRQDAKNAKDAKKSEIIKVLPRGIDEKFARQVDAFIKRYYSALKELAQSTWD